MHNVADLVGCGFANGGRNPATGLDCWGLVMEVYRRYGINIPDFDISAWDFVAINKLIKGQQGAGIWEKVDRAALGGEMPLVALIRLHMKLITHVGVLIAPNKLMHTMIITGAVVVKPSSFGNLIEGYYRYVPGN